MACVNNEQILNYVVKTTNYRRENQMWNNKKRCIKKKSEKLTKE